MLVPAFSAVFLVAAMEALLVQWTSHAIAPAVLVLDFVATAGILALVAVPVAGGLALTRWRGATAVVPLFVVVALYDLSRIRTEKLGVADPVTIAAMVVLAASGAGALRLARSGVAHLLIGGTASVWIVFHLGGRFTSVSTALGLVIVATVSSLLVTRWSERRAGAAFVPVFVLSAFAVVTYPFAPGVHHPHVSDAEPTTARAADGAPNVNVIVIVMDTVRADHLSLYGYEPATSPELARFAERASVFRNAIANSNWSLPSHATLLTGLLPHQHLAHTVVASRPDVPPSSQAVEIAQRPLSDDSAIISATLRDAGYDTGVVTANYAWLSPEHGLLRGFDYVDNRTGTMPAWEPFCGPYIRHAPSRLLREHFALSMRSKLAADRIVDHVLDFVGRPRERPFFLLVNFMDAHAPYDSAIRAERVPEIRESLRSARWPAANLETYDRSIAFLDHELGRLFGALEARRLFTDSLIVVTSDHGERFGTAARGWHGADLSQESVHIPLLVKLPRQSKTDWIDETAQLADVVPTILETVGLPSSEEFFGSPMARSSSAVVAESYLASGGILSDERTVSLAALDERLPTQWALFDWPWKLVRDGAGRRSLYDVAADPGERHDLAARSPDVVERLDQRLAESLPEHAFTAYRTPIEQAAASAATVEKLKSLGYAQ